MKRGMAGRRGMRGVEKKIGNDSRKIIRKRCPKIALRVLYDRSETLRRVFALSYTAQDANANHLYLRKRGFRIRRV